MNPKVTIIIPTRNRAHLLMNRSLPSALGQTFKDYEIIVIDDCSDEIYPFFEPPVTYIRNFQRRGLACNRNLGVDYGTGEYVVGLDDDNELAPDFLEKTVAYLDEHTEHQAVSVGKYIQYPEGTVCQPPVTDGSMNDGFLIRRNAFQKIRCDETLNANEDADFGIRFRKEFAVGAINEVLMTVYGSPVINTTSYSDYSDYHLDGLARFWLKHHEYKEYVGRMFMLSSEKKLFRWMHWLEQKLKRYYHIWLSRVLR